MTGGQSTLLVMRGKADQEGLRGGGFPGISVEKNLPANAGDIGLIPDPGRCHMLRSN